MASALILLVVGLATAWGANVAPTAQDLALTVREAKALSFNLSATDPDGGVTPFPPTFWLTYRIVSPPAQGTLVQTYDPDVYYGIYSEQMVYTPATGFLGTVTFTYKADDGLADSNVATVTITVTANQVPVASTSSATVGMGGTVLLKPQASDGDLDALAITVTVPPEQGSVVPATWPDGQPMAGWLAYTAAPGFSGTDSFAFTVNDGLADSNQATVTITVPANTAPVLLGGSFWVCTDLGPQTILTGGGLRRLVDPDPGQPFSFVVTTPPAHGSLSAPIAVKVTEGWWQFECAYTPQAGFVGEDYFHITASDGTATSQPARFRVVVRDPAQPAGAKVLVVVESALAPELQPEIARLVADLQAEGWAAQVLPWSGTAEGLWQELRSAYLDTTQCLVGALLLGDVPVPGRTMNYWQLWSYRTDTFETDDGMDIWVSRLKAPKAEQLRYALDANHRQRTGQGRVPLRQWRWWSQTDPYINDDSLARREALAQVWPEQVTQSITNAHVEGAEYAWYDDHDSGKSYTEGTVSTPTAPDHIRFYVDEGCGSGARRCRSLPYARGGHTVLSFGSGTEWGGGGSWGDLLLEVPGAISMFNRGESLGTILMAGGRTVHPHSFGDYLHWGDLTIAPKRTPGNQLPSATVSASSNVVTAGQTVTFTINATDADAAATDNPQADHEYLTELWPYGYLPATFKGTVEPLAASTWASSSIANGTMSWTYQVPHAYKARIEVVDEWQARRVKEVTVVVAPDPARALRINCGNINSDWQDADGGLWLFDQKLVDGSVNQRWGHAQTLVSSSEVVTRSTTATITGTEAVPVLQVCRLATSTDRPVTWTIPLTNGTYTVRLHFADLAGSAAGQSLADVSIGGQMVLQAFDAYAAAGGACRAVIREFEAVVGSGSLAIILARNASSPSAAFLNAIEIIPAARDRTIRLDAVDGCWWEAIQPADAVTAPPVAGQMQAFHLRREQTAILAPQATTPSGDG